MKEWGSEPDEKHDKLLVAEGALVGILVIGVYVFVLLEVIRALADLVLLFVA